MDILISSNLERLLYHLAGPEAVRGWMAELAENKRFQVDPETFRAVRELLVGDFVTNDESLATIKRVWDEAGYLMDPHTAVAWEVAERMQGDAPVLVVSTAHWAKFGGDVLKALRGRRVRRPAPERVRGAHRRGAAGARPGDRDRGRVRAQGARRARLRRPCASPTSSTPDARASRARSGSGSARPLTLAALVRTSLQRMGTT